MVLIMFDFIDCRLFMYIYTIHVWYDQKKNLNMVLEINKLYKMRELKRKMREFKGKKNENKISLSVWGIKPQLVDHKSYIIPLLRLRL